MTLEDFKIYVINLDRREDRLEAFLDRFEPLGLGEIERFAAVDGTAEDVPKEWEARGAGAWGCFLSHWRLIERAYAEGLERILIFEDDAEPLYPPEEFAEALKATLAELPSDWEQFYLGCEHLHGTIEPPTRISEHLVIPYNANRTHAYALTRSGMRKALDLFADHENWHPGWHVDWAYGSLHETKQIRVYAAYPPLFGQAAGVSDIDPRVRTPLKHWKPYTVRDFRAGSVIVTSEKVGYGRFEARIPQTFDREIYDGFFAHAPSEIKVEVSEPTEVFAAHGITEGAWEPSSALVDGKKIGEVMEKGSTTGTVTLEPGPHTLSFETVDNRAAHTFWLFRPVSRLPFKEGATFEIFSNAKCPRHCPHCNQQKTMTECPGYEYTAQDAEALAAVLPVKVNLVFSGGEPAMLGVRKWRKILGTFRDSGKVGRIAVTTSDDSEKWLSFAAEQFDRVHLSHRPSMKWPLNERPAHVSRPNIAVWDTDTHHPWPKERFTGLTRCCCTNVNIHAAIFGDTVCPCVLAQELALRKPDTVPGGVPLEDYFTGKRSFAPIGTYEACRWCVNNDNYRATADRVPTA